MSGGTTTPGDPRASMARSRTGIAGLRTQLGPRSHDVAWIRTSLTTGTFGFGWPGGLTGSLCGSYRRGEPLELTRWPLALVLALLLAILFLAGLWVLLAR
jgi:uncharacterized membrane protein YidH (DUF202 family)